MKCTCNIQNPTKSKKYNKNRISIFTALKNAKYSANIIYPTFANDPPKIVCGFVYTSPKGATISFIGDEIGSSCALHCGWSNMYGSKIHKFTHSKAKKENVEI